MGRTCRCTRTPLSSHSPRSGTGGAGAQHRPARVPARPDRAAPHRRRRLADTRRSPAAGQLRLMRHRGTRLTEYRRFAELDPTVDTFALIDAPKLHRRDREKRQRATIAHRRISLQDPEATRPRMLADTRIEPDPA